MLVPRSRMIRGFDRAPKRIVEKLGSSWRESFRAGATEWIQAGETTEAVERVEGHMCAYTHARVYLCKK
jgi:hypothetical protein